MAVGNRKLMVEEDVDFGALMDRRDELASSGRTAVLVAVDGRGVGVIALADAARETSADAVAALHELGVEVVMLSGDNQATAKRIAAPAGYRHRYRRSAARRQGRQDRRAAARRQEGRDGR